MRRTAYYTRGWKKNPEGISRYGSVVPGSLLYVFFNRIQKILGNGQEFLDIRTGSLKGCDVPGS